MWFARNFGYFFLVPGLLMILGGAFFGYRTYRFSTNALRAHGTVVQNRYDGETYHPEVRFESKDGRPHVFVSNTGSSPASYKPGEAVGVLYDEDAPESASIDSFFQQWFGTLMISGMGLIFGLIGVIPLWLRRRSAERRDWLQLNGQRIQAQLNGVRLNSNLEINGRHPYRIEAQWLNPATNQVHLFHSENLWYDPSAHVTGKTVNVIIDPKNPKRYWLDITFLPKVAE